MKKLEKYLYIVSPLLIVVSLLLYYVIGKFGVASIATLTVGLLVGLLFFVRFHKEVVQKITRRKVKYGLNSFLITVVILAIVVVVYLVMVNHNKRFDLTSVKRFSLSEQTRTVLSEFEGPIKVYAFYFKNMETVSIIELFTEYGYLYKDFEYEIIDPDMRPAMVEEMGVEEYGELYLRYGGKTEKIKAPSEEGITNALIKVSSTGFKNVYFITGHGEKSIEDYGKGGYDLIKKAIEAENYKVEEVLLLREDTVPVDCAVLVSAGPTGDYDEHEVGLIEDYIQSGGSAFFLIDPDEKGAMYPNIGGLLERYGLTVGNNIIIDPLSRVLSGDYFMPVINSYTFNPITNNFRLATFLRFARSVEPNGDAGENVFARTVANTGEASWAETDLEALFTGSKAKFDEGEDLQGPVSIMAYATVTLPPEDAIESAPKGDAEETEDPAAPPEQREAIVLAVGDSDFASNSMFETQGNKDLFLNSINFLADKADLITIRPKQQESVYITLTAKQGRLAFFVSLILIPLVVIVIGLYITIQRRVKS